MNFGTPVPLLIGIVLIVGAIALFFVDQLKPGYGRSSDRVYAVLWLISGVFLLGHLNMELLASFQQLLMAGMLIAITVENVLSRRPKDDRYAPQRAPEPPPQPYRPSRGPGGGGYRTSPRMNVRAELDNEPSLRDGYGSDRRMLGGRNDRAAYGDRAAYYPEDYPERYDDRPYGAATDRPVGRLNPASDRIRRRRSKGGPDARYDIDYTSTAWDESPGGYSAGQDGYSSSSLPPSRSAYPNGGEDSDSYVDYRPVDYPEQDSDQSSKDYDRDYDRRY